jgi:hypothetical protein
MSLLRCVPAKEGHVALDSFQAEKPGAVLVEDSQVRDEVNFAFGFKEQIGYELLLVVSELWLVGG